MKKILILLVLISVLTIFGLHLYYNIYKHGYEDKQYQFLLLDTRGWGILEPKEGVYMILGTSKSNTVVSSAGIAPVLKAVNESSGAQEDLQKTCDENYIKANANNKVFKQLDLNNLSGYVCTYETKGVNAYVNEVIVVSQFLLINKPNKKYDYVITTHHPKNDPEEVKKVERLINGFEAK